jgi:hypothetical protein
MASQNPDRPTGLLVVHGIGEQQPGETLAKVVTGIKRAYGHDNVWRDDIDGGDPRILTLRVKGRGRLRHRISTPAIVCIQSGNVNTGAFDPAKEIIAMAHAAGAWVHVDGAFGLWAAVSPQRAHLAEDAI